MEHKTDWKLKDTVTPGDMNRIEGNIKELETPSFNDSGTVSDINSFTDFVNSVKSKMSIFDFFRNFKAGLKYIVHQGQIINSQDVTQAGFAMDARQANPNIPGSLGAKISDLNNNISYEDYSDTQYPEPKANTTFFSNWKSNPAFPAPFGEGILIKGTDKNWLSAYYQVSDASRKAESYISRYNLTDKTFEWDKVITNSDINVRNNTDKTLLTSIKDNVMVLEPQGTYYIIRNDYCFVSLSAIKMTSTTGGIVFTNLPRPVGRVNFTLHLAGGDSKPIIWGLIEDGSTNIHFNDVKTELLNIASWCSFCYPIAK